MNSITTVSWILCSNQIPTVEQKVIKWGCSQADECRSIVTPRWLNELLSSMGITLSRHSNRGRRRCPNSQRDVECVSLNSTLLSAPTRLVRLYPNDETRGESFLFQLIEVALTTTKMQGGHPGCVVASRNLDVVYRHIQYLFPHIFAALLQQHSATNYHP